MVRDFVGEDCCYWTGLIHLGGSFAFAVLCLLTCCKKKEKKASNQPSEKEEGAKVEVGAEIASDKEAKTDSTAVGSGTEVKETPNEVEKESTEKATQKTQTEGGKSLITASEKKSTLTPASSKQKNPVKSKSGEKSEEKEIILAMSTEKKTDVTPDTKEELEKSLRPRLIEPAEQDREKVEKIKSGARVQRRDPAYATLKGLKSDWSNSLSDSDPKEDSENEKETASHDTPRSGYIADKGSHSSPPLPQ